MSVMSQQNKTCFNASPQMAYSLKVNKFTPQLSIKNNVMIYLKM